MPAPVADKPRCDVPGCGNYAAVMTDGTEKDAQEALNRKAIPHLNVCDRHTNWPHSNDAQAFANGDVYRNRLSNR